MQALFYITYSIWFGSETVIGRLRRAKGTDLQNADKNSLAVLWVVMGIGISLAVFVSFRVRLPIMHNGVIRYVGLGLMWVAIAFRLAIIFSLGRMFTVDVTIRPDHRLKTDGFYRFVRHPSYTASLLTFFAFGLTLNNWLSLALVTLPIMAVFWYRIRVEEAALVGRFGEEYVTYRKRTNALVPLIF